MSEHFRDKGLIIKCYINLSVYFALNEQSLMNFGDDQFLITVRW